MLTHRQKQVRDFVEKTISRKSVAPSEREIAKHFRIAPSTVHEHLKEIEERGYLNRNPGKRRGISIRKNEGLIKIPLPGAIAAGEPIHVFEEQRETIAVPKSKIYSSSEVYALRVVGNSMVDENINDGDIILVKQQTTAENGQKVVALLNGNEATLKTFYKEKGQIRLQPANKNFQPIIVKNGQELALQGVLLDVIKTNETERPAQTLISPSKERSQQRCKITNYLNKIYNGDVMRVLKDLPDNSVDMIFGDPDYNVGIKYGGNNYTKNFDEYINWYIELTKESMRVLKNDGNLFMLNYPQQNAHLRVKYLDLQFPYINEYVWVYNTNVGHTPKRFTTAHRSILHVRKNIDNKFFKDEVALPYKNPTDRRIRQNLANGSRGRMPYSWFEFNLVKNVSKEKTEHACQIPQKLTEMLIKATTKPRDIALILFGGSGAEIDVCKKLNRQFISAELNKKYCDIINSRLSNGFIVSKYKLLNGKKRT
ncbi:MAG: methylase N-4/N-6 domain protein [Candidatus Yanofskybacteria bacterium GW2011_GWC2_41_9]|uniref:LexA repressor n=2 Tax=Parcubacteria group TaxID=1794811 RepID=A0A0G0XKE1_9BACT|nr:MAG: methylase N-4/N-6 domain protein [Candidatus Yanofskybacteria bacterium GW2011_GWC2_41_9]